MKLRAVAFDVDGTLYSNREMYLKSLWFGLRNIRLLRAMTEVRQVLRETRLAGDFYANQAALIAERMGWNPVKSREILDTRIYRDWEDVLSRLHLLPGIIETLEACRSAGLKLAVASDFPVERKMKLLGLDGWWDFALSTEKTGFIKPHPEPFLAICEALQLQSQEILYVGNSYECDVVGAKGVGMVAAHYARRAKPNSRADLTFSSYFKLKQWIMEKSR